MVCRKCGKEINNNYICCPYCGTTIDDKISNAENYINNDFVSNNPSPVGLVLIIVGIILAVATIIFMLITNDHYANRPTSNSTLDFIAGVIIFYFFKAGLLVYIGLKALVNGALRYLVTIIGMIIYTIGSILFFFTIIGMSFFFSIVGMLIAIIGLFKEGY